MKFVPDNARQCASLLVLMSLGACHAESPGPTPVTPTPDARAHVSIYPPPQPDSLAQRQDDAIFKATRAWEGSPR